MPGRFCFIYFEIPLSLTNAAIDQKFSAHPNGIILLE
jgi:hypothetical protein